MHRRICLVLFLIIFSLAAASAQAADDNQVLLETIGGLSGSYLYISYAYIGMTADIFAKDIYQADQVKAMMDDHSMNLTDMANRLAKVRRTNMAEPDKKMVDGMIEILSLLKTEAQALGAFAASQDDEDLERFEQARKAAWLKMKKLLGIK